MLIKALVEGDSSTGKTSLLVSLLAAGYKIKLLDYDNKTQGLRAFVKYHCPETLSNLDIRPLRDAREASPNGPILKGPPRAFSGGLDLLDKWDGAKPAELGEDYVVVIDTLTTMSQAAYNWALLMGGHLSYVEGVNVKGGPDPRNIIYTAQRAIINTINLLTSEFFQTNVLVLSHIKYFDRDGGITKSYPVTIGSAIAPEVPSSFSCVIQLETQMLQGAVVRTIRTVSTPMIDLQTPVPFNMPKEIHIPDMTTKVKDLGQTGLAKFFDIVRNS